MGRELVNYSSARCQKTKNQKCRLINKFLNNLSNTISIKEFRQNQG